MLGVPNRSSSSVDRRKKSCFFEKADRKRVKEVILFRSAVCGRDEGIVVKGIVARYWKPSIHCVVLCCVFFLSLLLSSGGVLLVFFATLRPLYKKHWLQPTLQSTAFHHSPLFFFEKRRKGKGRALWRTTVCFPNGPCMRSRNGGILIMLGAQENGGLVLWRESFF